MGATAIPLRRAMTANSVANSFATLVPQANKPSGPGVFDLFDGGLGLATQYVMPKYVQVVPFGTDLADETFDLRVWGWSKVHNPGGADHGRWVPQLLLDLAVTLGTAAQGEADHFLADTLSITQGDGDAPVISPQNNTPASAILHLRGCEVIQFDFARGTAAAANAYWRLMDECG